MIFAARLAHYFYPGYSNNHKAKLLHSTTLFLLVAFIIVFQVFLSSAPSVGLKVLGYSANIPPDQIITLTNKRRTEAGLSPLTYNPALTSAAKPKGDHMLAYDYWAHVASDGTEPWSFFISAGYKYRYAGENLARDFSDPNSAVEAWMASPSHRDNMLSSKYKDIGVAVVEGDLAGVDTTIIVQLFGTQLSDTSTPVPVAQARPEATPSPTLIPSPKITLVPTQTLLPAPIAQTSIIPTPQINELGNLELSQEKASGFQILLSPFDTTRSISLATIILLSIVMIIDAVVIARRKIPRVGGRTFAHLAFLGMILALILIAKAGQIL
ncbi:hypothetical protein A3H19_05610 [Candidatus Woesebacteria bacterium RIFCSPLOWO2_12_FULL_39_9]|nr:MAG: hypothetical protein A3H19_05610 [Candidatus Woesebacteria bacterium RIFCSPLOWO2_12_FULL_39_9]